MERLHRASKNAPRVVIYAYKQPEKILKDAIDFKAHKVETWTVVELDPAFLDRIAQRTDKVNKWDLAISGGALYLTIGKELLESTAKVHTQSSLGL